MKRLTFFTAALLLALAPATGVAQSALDKPPKRPGLPAKADTNSAVAYHYYGTATLTTDPDKAAAAFYWASRLDPTWAAPLYGQHAALLLAQPHTELTTYLTRRHIARREPMFQHIDSLADLAILKNPFVDRRFYGVVLSTWIAQETGNEIEMRDVGQRDRWFTAWAAYTRGDFAMATAVYADLIKQDPENPDLRIERAWCFFGQARYDSARASVQEALGIERTTEANSVGVGWVSHAYAEYSIGFLFDLGEQHDSAMAAYERALLDDVTLVPAHRLLGRARLAAHDTTGALAEYVQAASLAPKDATYLYDLGMLLVAKGQSDSGVAVLLRTTAVEPYFALPHYTLGLVYEQSGFRQEATEHFAAFLRLAPRTMGPAIASAQAHLAAVQGGP